MGAQMEAIDNNGDTPLTAAIKSGKTEVAVCMKIMGAELQREKNLMCHAANTDTELSHIVLFLVKKGMPVNRRDEKGNIALHYAVMRKDEFAVEILLQAGALTDSKNLDGETPYSLALKAGNIEILRLFRQNSQKGRQPSVRFK